MGKPIESDWMRYDDAHRAASKLAGALSFREEDHPQLIQCEQMAALWAIAKELAELRGTIREESNRAAEAYLMGVEAGREQAEDEFEEELVPVDEPPDSPDPEAA